MYAQIIDDTVGNTLCAASTMDKDVKAACEKTKTMQTQQLRLVQQSLRRHWKKGITTVVFDRGGFIYQG